ncbi:hypothetical protein [Acinetobacter zhairhuonensis]|uniref:hypothetical protein n=1 Tax=Acinetobacter sp. A7.4 TaxID=2919921 RepID=UPI001F4F87DA|nr:hypothetical protein [Acinetobacter sp. A7.4]MCJ8161883.1 hypothetical protein [Acinetobacter sp. A7.4]
MSKKIDVLSIIEGHLFSLRNSDGSFNFFDFLTFFILPLTLSTLSVFFISKVSNDTISLLVNFGSIFTALLLSVLVLIFDQENKIDEHYEKYLIFKEELDKNPDLSKSPAYSYIFNKNLDENYETKKTLLKELYFNISFSIVVSLFLVLMCLAYSNLGDYLIVTNVCVLMKVVVFFIVLAVTTLFLNILMIVKRMHVMLTT